MLTSIVYRKISCGTELTMLNAMNIGPKIAKNKRRYIFLLPEESESLPQTAENAIVAAAPEAVITPISDTLAPRDKATNVTRRPGEPIAM
jgi:hypothetical protein